MTSKKKKGARAAERPKVRYAVVGLGYISQQAVLPAFAHARKNSELVALVSDEEEKLRQLGRKYQVPHRVTYDQFDDFLKRRLVDAVFIGLPNHLHRDYAVRTARAGVHVLCEKPMAVTEEDCLEMIDAAERAGVRLMVGYRLHFEASNLAAVELARSGKLGDVRAFSSVFSMQVEAGNIRLNPIRDGGGTLYDIGIYCINAARYLFRAEPREVFAMSLRSDDPRFTQCDETTSAILRFPGDRLASFTTSFNSESEAFYELLGTRGRLRADGAYHYDEPIQHTLVLRGRTQRRKFPKRDQFAPELLYFSDCILQGHEPEPSGREGLADVRIIRALYQSARQARPVSLAPFEKSPRPSIEQAIRRPPVREPELVRAASPSGQ
jgi:glucose-fructose oxidoreductase